jgi:hypothetical protein
MQFTLGAPAAPPPASAYPPSGAPAAPPPASAYPPSGAPAPPATSGFPQQPPTNPRREDVGDSATQERDPIPPRSARQSSKLQLFVLAGTAAVLMAGTVLAVVYMVMNRGKNAQGDSVLKDKDRNLSIGKMPKGWAQDTTLWVKYGSPYVYGFKRENPEAYVLFGSAAYDGGQREPRMSEMRDDLVKPLTKMFDMTTLTMEPALANTLMGVNIPANLGFKFRAQSSDALIWQGEAYAVPHRGRAYFWVSWCGESDFDTVKAEFAEFREQFKLLEPRDDWKPKKPNAVDYKGDTVSYTFTDTEDIWKEEQLDDSKPPELIRWLRINHTPRADRKAIPEEAELRVYVLDGGGDPLSRAKDFVQNLWTERLKRDNPDLPAPTFEELTGDSQGDPVDSPLGSAPVVRYQTRVLEGKKVIAATESRLLVASAIKVGDKVVVLQCWCESGKRNVFESRFIHIASTLR